MKGTKFETEGFEESKKDDAYPMKYMNIITLENRCFTKWFFLFEKPSKKIDPLGPGDSYNIYLYIEGWILAD